MRFTEKIKTLSLNAGNLKMIALFCMVIDHFGVAILFPLYSNNASLYPLYCAFRFIGRLAFPIFCFFITEGYFHTGNKVKYALRLLLLAVISEVPFDMVLKHKYYAPECQNVFFTLLAGMLTVWAIDSIGKTQIKKRLSFVIRLLIAAASCFLINFAVKGDYGAIGVFSIVAVYLSVKDEKAMTVILYAAVASMELISSFEAFDNEFYMLAALATAGFFLLIFVVYMPIPHLKSMAVTCTGLTAFNPSEIFSFADVVLILKYNGEKGKINKWFFYFFYPVHLLILALLCMALKLY